MVKPPKLPHVKYVRTGGHLYAYFNTGRKHNGRVIYTALPRPGTVGFFDSYAACLAGRNRTPAETYTVERLCEDYQDSKEFGRLAEGSRRAYAVYLRLVVELLGKAAVDDVTRADVQYILDRETMGPGKQNLFVAVIGAIYKWGRARDKTQNWPTREIVAAETGEHMPWPDDVLQAGLNADSDQIRLAVALLFYTGQRIGDVCAMRWADLKTGSLKIVQQKTGKPLTIPLFSALRAELDRYGKRGVTLLTNAVGAPMRPDNLRTRLKELCAERGHPGLRPHGLRKNAVIALLSAGCSVAETAAITGQTYQLVEYYARQIDQEKMAEAAIYKWEQKVPRKTSGKTAAQSRRKP